MDKTFNKDNGKTPIEIINQISNLDLSENQKEFNWYDKAKILTEILPYAERFSGSIFVISINGKAIDNPKTMKNLAQDIALLKYMGINPIIVHGVGKQVEKMLKRLNMKPLFIDDKMIIDKNIIEIFEMVASGSINKNLTMEINKLGCKAIGISGKDGKMIQAEKIKKVRAYEKSRNIDKIIDLGFVGQPTIINIELLGDFEEPSFIPVISPIGMGEDGTTYAIDPDLIAGLISSVLAATKMIILGETENFLMKNEELIDLDDMEKLKELVDSDKIKDNIANKIKICINAIENGVESIQLLDSSVPHVLLRDVFSSNQYL